MPPLLDLLDAPIVIRRPLRDALFGAPPPTPTIVGTLEPPSATSGVWIGKGGVPSGGLVRVHDSTAPGPRLTHPAVLKETLRQQAIASRDAVVQYSKSDAHVGWARAEAVPLGWTSTSSPAFEIASHLHGRAIADLGSVGPDTRPLAPLEETYRQTAARLGPPPAVRTH